MLIFAQRGPNLYCGALVLQPVERENRMKKPDKNLLLALSLATTALLSHGVAAAQHSACGGVPLSVCPTPFDRALPDPKTMLSWDQQDRVVGFRNDYRNYPADVFRHGAARPLPLARRQLGEVSYQVNGQRYSLADYLQRQNVAGMLVLKNGQIAYKYLAHGNSDSTLWTSRSVGNRWCLPWSAWR